MADDEEYGNNEGWIKLDDFPCLKCGRLIELPKKWPV